MKLIESLKKKKFLLFNIFFTLYIGINLIGGERGLVSYFEKNTNEKKLNIKVFELESELESVEHRNKLLSKNIDLDYLDTLFRSKLKFGTKDEILIRFR